MLCYSLFYCPQVAQRKSVNAGLRRLTPHFLASIQSLHILKECVNSRVCTFNILTQKRGWCYTYRSAVRLLIVKHQQKTVRLILLLHLLSQCVQEHIIFLLNAVNSFGSVEGREVWHPMWSIPCGTLTFTVEGDQSLKLSTSESTLVCSRAFAFLLSTHYNLITHCCFLLLFR